MAGRVRSVPVPSLFDRLAASFSVGLVDGAPAVEGLRSDVIEQRGAPYLERFFLLGGNAWGRGESARYHHIVASDVADLHDHPWDFMSVILSGSYVESTPSGEQEFGPGSVLLRKAEQLHRLTLVKERPVWSLVVVSQARRKWGFQTADGWVHWSQYDVV